MKLQKTAALILTLATLIFTITLIYLDFTTVNHNWQTNYISNLGTSQNATIFNSILITCGLLLVLATLLIYLQFKDTLFTFLLLINSLGIAAVGIFPKNVSFLHSAAALITFISIPITIYYSKKIIKTKQKLLTTLVIISLLTLPIFALAIYFNKSIGIAEHLIVLPWVIWSITFSYWLYTQN